MSLAVHIDTVTHGEDEDSVHLCVLDDDLDEIVLELEIERPRSSQQVEVYLRPRGDWRWGPGGFPDTYATSSFGGSRPDEPTQLIRLEVEVTGDAKLASPNLEAELRDLLVRAAAQHNDAYEVSVRVLKDDR